MSDSPIVLTLTIYPVKKTQRKIVVTGAPEGEMPLLLEGVFAERHALLDQAFTAVLKRDPQVITLKAAKPKTSKSKATSTADSDDDEAETDDSAMEEVTPAVAAGPSGNISNDADTDLPVIEGDTKASDDDDEPAAQVADKAETNEEQDSWQTW